jgi:hypothetical protein
LHVDDVAVDQALLTRIRLILTEKEGAIPRRSNGRVHRGIVAHNASSSDRPSTSGGAASSSDRPSTSGGVAAGTARPRTREGLALTDLDGLSVTAAGSSSHTGQGSRIACMHRGMTMRPPRTAPASMNTSDEGLTGTFPDGWFRMASFDSGGGATSSSGRPETSPAVSGSTRSDIAANVMPRPPTAPEGAARSTSGCRRPSFKQHAAAHGPPPGTQLTSRRHQQARDAQPSPLGFDPLPGVAVAGSEVGPPPARRCGWGPAAATSGGGSTISSRGSSKENGMTLSEIASGPGQNAKDQRRGGTPLSSRGARRSPSKPSGRPGTCPATRAADSGLDMPAASRSEPATAAKTQPTPRRAASKESAELMPPIGELVCEQRETSNAEDDLLALVPEPPSGCLGSSLSPNVARSAHEDSPPPRPDIRCFMNVSPTPRAAFSPVPAPPPIPPPRALCGQTTLGARPSPPGAHPPHLACGGGAGSADVNAVGCAPRNAALSPSSVGTAPASAAATSASPLEWSGGSGAAASQGVAAARAMSALAAACSASATEAIGSEAMEIGISLGNQRSASPPKSRTGTPKPGARAGTPCQRAGTPSQGFQGNPCVAAVVTRQPGRAARRFLGSAAGETTSAVNWGWSSAAVAEPTPRGGSSHGIAAPSLDSIGVGPSPGSSPSTGAYAADFAFADRYRQLLEEGA